MGIGLGKHGHFLRQNMVHNLFVLLHGTSYVQNALNMILKWVFQETFGTGETSLSLNSVYAFGGQYQLKIKQICHSM
jgi:hypothetical protein